MRDGIKAICEIPSNNFRGIDIYEIKPKLADNFQLYQKKSKFQAAANHMVFNACFLADRKPKLFQLFVHEMPKIMFSAVHNPTLREHSLDHQSYFLCRFSK